ncbi:retinoblastoma-like protein 1 [Dermatophagoides pteronyssinus]|uniref:retinoblastoma-like protein 1 n=1 Tax=Dermatophagoides pteronyssinus TaxID=6956 RepID=UPI003F66D468
MDWLACALYISCRKCTTQMGRGQARIEGNMVSLTRILRSCNISLVRFFNKIKNWIDMAGSSVDLRKKIEQIEKNFNVTSVIFKKYKPIFEEVFKCPIPPCRFSPKIRKIRKQPLNSMDIFTFCWTLFVFVKSRFSKIGDHLVNSYHLLLVCIDYCFSSVLSFDNYRDIVNTNFYDKLTKEFKNDLRSLNNDERISIIDTLCEKFNGIPVEVKHIRQHWFKSLLNKLIDNNNLRKRTNGIIDNDAIDFNYKYIKKEYEDFVLTVGDFDECIFLNEAASKELGTAELQSQFEIDEKLFQQQQQVSYDNNSNGTLGLATPLSSKQYLDSRTPVKQVLTPISAATTSISRLHSILKNHTNEPSKDLVRIFEKCDKDPQTKIKDIIKRMGDIFSEAYAKSNQDQSIIRSNEEFQCIMTSGHEFANKRRVFAETFFYYIFEKILKGELSKRIPQSNLSQSLSKIVSSDILIRSLYACSLEIILFSYNICNRVFPWILQIYDDHPQLKIPPFFFYKVIEPIIREELGLSRDIVKHLNTIEEQILDCLAWTKDSPLWVLLSKTSSPTSAEVSLDFFNNNQDGRENSAPFMKSPVIRSDTNNLTNVIYSGFPGGNVKRKLFTNNNADASKNITPQTPVCQDVSVIRSTKSIIQTSTPVKQESDECLVPSPKSTILSTPVSKNQRNSQIALFFRKVYSLASHRLQDLFKRLQITSDEVKRKIWTCFENAIQAHTYLMCDHHLDQIIMCCIYAVARININSECTITFANIIDKYRLQPQGSSIVYRNVLLTVAKKLDSIVEHQQSETTASSSPETNEKFGSVIDFYNKIFVPNLTSSYILQFSSEEKNPNVKLSPMPRNKFASSNIQSPLRCVPNYPVFVSPLRQSTYVSPSKNITYRFQNNLTTSKDLEQINNMMKLSTAAHNNPHMLTMPSSSLGNHNSHHRDMKASIATAMISMSSLGGAKRSVSKRILQDDNENGGNVSASPKKIPRRINLKIHEIFSERQIISGSSSANASTSVSGDESNDSIQFNNPSANGNMNILAPKMEISNKADGHHHQKSSRPIFGNEDHTSISQIESPIVQSFPKHQPISQPVVAQIIQQQSNGDMESTAATAAIVHHQNVIVPVTTITSNLIRADHDIIC